MTLPVFVVDPAALRGKSIELAGVEGRHAVVVRRIRPGERIVLTDTLGAGVECVVRSVVKQSLVAEPLLRRWEPVALPRLVVVQAIPKGDHGERAVDLLTELGVDSIVPWAAGRAVVSWSGDRGIRGIAKWRSAAYAAAKQSRRLRFPHVAEVQTTGEVVAMLGAAGLGLVLHQGAQIPITQCDVPSESDVVLVVGPEGGITDTEREVFSGTGAREVRLGPSVLRSSTAGVVAAAAVMSRTTRWS